MQDRNFFHSSASGLPSEKHLGLLGMKKTILDHIAPRKGILAGCVFVFLLLCILRAQDTTKSKAKAAISYPQEISKITFVVAGDVIPHQSVSEPAPAQEKTQTPKLVQ